MIEVTFQTLTTLLSNISPKFASKLRSPADAAQIENVSREVPMALPDELWTLYKLHDGESEMGGLFFGLPWLSLEAALREWHTWDKLAAAESDNSAIEQNLASIPEAHIRKKAFNTHYFPISKDGGGNCLMIDLDPDKKGTKGQIINYGSDEYTRYVIAPSLNDFLAFCIYQLEAENYTIRKEDGEASLLLREPDNDHFLDTLPYLNLPFYAGE